MTRRPALPTLSELENKIGSVSCLRPRRLCDSVVLPLVIPRQHGLTQIETAQQDCGEEDHGDRSFRFLSLCSTLNSKLLQRRYKLINLSLPRDSAGMDSADWIFYVSSFIF